MSQTAQTLITLLGAGGLGAIVAAVISAFAARRKLGADAAKIITDAAAGVVSTLNNELTRQRAENEDLVTSHRAAIQTLMLNHAEEMEEVRRVLQLHVAWDGIAIMKMAELGIELPPAPPLTPARRFPKPTFTDGILDV